ncbi:NTP transferase domain-containing protein [Gimibacter soli]|uniref:NTP transferase domain-containing protein n=1 Tax=Gimibacter soli TaxID=3024400 RepID=A0AAE9XNC3_9PROT|nr:NTP transferase domain-containing protein [Gimibacter soli]WCL53212.1 NTP transferase domain-containing protein [Gimibacter soli]
MDFEDRAPADAIGWQLAHSLPFPGGKLTKGHLLTDADIDRMGNTARTPVGVFRLGPDDCGEDDAATRIAATLAGAGVRAAAPVHGRVDLFAAADGLLQLPTDQPQGLGGYPTALATLSPSAPVKAGDKVASLKVIPFGLPSRDVKALAAAAAALQVAPFKPFRAALLNADAPGGEKLVKVTDARLAAAAGALAVHADCGFDKASLADALAKASTASPDVILIAGKAAITDARDIVPAALVAAGGEVLQLGLAVDPGNLLMLGKLGNSLVIGMPGCARSPARNGLDLVLERFAARLPLDPAALSTLGAGGLLEPGRGRIEVTSSNAEPRIAAIVLAAGSARRAGGVNKLTSRLNGEPVLARSIRKISEPIKNKDNIIVITGHDSASSGAIAVAEGVVAIHNPAHAEGMSTSLKAGLAALPECDWFLVALGDMPFVRADTIKALINAGEDDPTAEIIAPLFAGRRGHPVLWRADLKAELMQVEGDKGGKAVMAAHEAGVLEVPVDDPGILIDLDTPELLALFGAVTEAP